VDTVTVEFFGVVRSKVGIAAIQTEGGTVRAILSELALRYPEAAELLTVRDNAPGPILVSINGERFIGDYGEFVPPGTRLLLLGMDAGG
jgi:molybdopterin converting factor small subunit